jgi:trk system potassium uptake protein TrkH
VLFNRRLSQNDVVRACTVATTYLLFLCCGVGFLLYFEGMEILSTLFEITSAIGTAGLSMGLTPQFGPPGKIYNSESYN